MNNPHGALMYAHPTEKDMERIRRWLNWILAKFGKPATPNGGGKGNRRCAGAISAR
jgi:hypothetical protein